MTELTKAQLIKEAKLKITVAKFYPNSEMARVEGELFKIALASLEAEPVAWMRDDADGREYNARNEFSDGGRGIPLYAAPPVPVVPDDGRDQFEALIRFHASDKNHETLLLRANEGMNYQEPNVDLAWIFWKSSRENLLLGKCDPGMQVCELTMLVKQLVSQLKKAKPDCKLPDKAMDYLKRNGLISVEDVLR
ncbi:TPA: hypothetical protein J5F79_000895 [Escherichia coli]|nr:hypothetical protein [Escherichia coli]